MSVGCTHRRANEQGSKSLLNISDSAEKKVCERAQCQAQAIKTADL